MALGIMEFFSNQGIRIPQDFSLIGFDDISIASFSFIQLTTIDSRKIEVVRTAIDLLFQKIADPNNKRVYRKKLLPKLVIRKTCGCP
jgi:LacI family transcriptional regulator